MKRNFVVGLFGSLVGFGMLFILLSAAGIVGARSADVPPRQARPGSVSAATPLTSTFTYQGQLKNGGNAVNGSCDMAFRMYDDPSADNLIGSPITTTVSIDNGFFTAGLNFGNSAVTGIARWLDIRVRCPAGGGSYTTLSPRQALTPAPVALTLGAPGSVSGYLVSGDSGPYYPTIGFNNSGPTDGSAYLAGVAGYGGLFQFHDETGDLTYYTGSNVPAGASHVNTPRLTIGANGNVGIGTTDPQRNLHVSSANSGLRLESTDSHYWTTTEYQTDSRLWHTGVGGSAVSNDVQGKYYILDGTAGQFRMVIDTLGNVVIGLTSACSTDKLLVFAGFSGAPCYSEAVRGESNSGVGVGGHSSSGIGVFGTSDSGTGVYGVSNSGTNIIEGYDGGTNNRRFAVQRATGNVLADGAYTGPADFAEMMPVSRSKEDYAPGDVLVIGADGKLTRSGQPNATNLAGVYSAKPGFLGDTEIAAHGIEYYDLPATQERIAVALLGIVPVKVTDENGPIHPGDLLTTSSTPGHAMKAKPVVINGVEIYPTGTILGKALEPWEHGTGVIKVLITLR